MTETPTPPPDVTSMSPAELAAWAATLLPPMEVRILQVGLALRGDQWRDVLIAGLRGGWQPGPVLRTPNPFDGQPFQREVVQRTTVRDRVTGTPTTTEDWRVKPTEADAGGLTSWLRPPFRIAAAEAKALGLAAQAAGMRYGVALAFGNTAADIDIG